MVLLADQMHVAASPWIMGLFVVIMLLTYVGVAYEGMHKTVAALLGGGVLVLLAVYLGLFKYLEIYGFLAKDLNVFGVIIGTGILVDGPHGFSWPSVV
jgi:Na+/H+ antiporter NhaD/arsenite permease-like protein